MQCSNCSSGESRAGIKGDFDEQALKGLWGMMKWRLGNEVRGQTDACSPGMDFQGCTEKFRLYFPQPKAGVDMEELLMPLPSQHHLNVRNLHFPSE